MSHVEKSALRVIDCAKTGESEQQIIRDIVSNVNFFLGGGSIDSHQISAALHRRRLSHGRVSDPDQCRDYVQHLFREATHVCRHADGHHYTIHKAEQCSDECTARYEQSRPQPRPVSACCFVETTTQGTCPFGCDD